MTNITDKVLKNDHNVKDSQLTKTASQPQLYPQGLIYPQYQGSQRNHNRNYNSNIKPKLHARSKKEYLPDL